MKLSINPKQLIGQLQKHFSILLSLCLVVVMLLEFFVIKHSVDLVLRVKNQVPNFQTRITRVNLQRYGAIEQRIEENNNYTATGVPVVNPFGPIPQKP